MSFVFSKIPLRGKLAWGQVAVSCLILAFGAIGSRALSQVDADLQIIYREYTLAAVDLAHISADVIRYRNTIIRALEVPTKEQFDRLTATLAEHRARIQHTVDRYAAASLRVSQSGRSEPEDLQSVRYSLDAYFASASKTIALLIQRWDAPTQENAAQFQHEAEIHAADNAGPKLIQVSLALDRLLETVTDVAKDLRDEGTRTIQDTSLVLMLMAIGIAICNLFVKRGVAQAAPLPLGPSGEDEVAASDGVGQYAKDREAEDMRPPVRFVFLLAVTASFLGGSSHALQMPFNKALTLGSWPVATEKGRGLQDTQVLTVLRQKIYDAKTQALGGQRSTSIAVLRDLSKRAGEIGDPDSRDEMMAKIATAQAELDDFDGAENTARRIIAGPVRSDVLVLIDAQRSAITKDPARYAFLKAEIGDINGALETAAMIEDTVARSYVIEGIAKKQVHAGHIAAAFTLASAIPDLSIRTTTLGKIAWAQTKGNHVSDAIKTIHAMQDDLARDRLLVDLAEWRAKRGDLVGARLLASEIGDESSQSLAKRYIDAYEIGPRKGQVPSSEKGSLMEK